MFSLIDKIKMIGIVFLITLIALGSARIWYLTKDNEDLVAKLAVVQSELKICTDNARLHKEKDRIVDQTLEQVFDNQDKIEDTFNDLKDSLNKQKCKDRVVYKKAETTNEKDVDSVAVELDSVRVLLERAACSANGDCKPTEGSPKAL